MPFQALGPTKFQVFHKFNFDTIQEKSNVLLSMGFFCDLYGKNNFFFVRGIDLNLIFVFMKHSFIH